MAAHAFYRFFTGDYLRDAGHLSLLEHGAYRRLIDLYMTTGEPLPFDVPRLYRLLHATSKEEQQAVQVVIEEFFRMDGAVLRHARCDRELQWQLGMSEVAARASRKRWSDYKQNQKVASGRNADGLRSVCDPEPEPEPEQESTPLTTISTIAKGRGARFALTAPPDDWRAWTAEHFPRAAVDRTFASFRDYWIAQPGQKGVKTDWFATWRNWVRRDNPGTGGDADAALIASIENDPRFKESNR